RVPPNRTPTLRGPTVTRARVRLTAQMTSPPATRAPPIRRTPTRPPRRVPQRGRMELTTPAARLKPKTPLTLTVRRLPARWETSPGPASGWPASVRARCSSGWVRSPLRSAAVGDDPQLRRTPPRSGPPDAMGSPDLNTSRARGQSALSGSELVPVARAVHERRGDRVGLEQDQIGRGAGGETEAGVLGQCRSDGTGARHELRTSAGGDVEAAFDVLIAAEPVRERQLPGAPQQITVAVGAPVVALTVLAEPEGQPTFGDRRLRQHCLGRSDGGQADARLIEEVEDPVDLGIGIRTQGEGVRDRHLTGHRQSLRALDDLLEGEDPGGAGLVQMDVDALAVLL